MENNEIEFLGDEIQFEYGEITIRHDMGKDIWLAEMFDEEEGHYLLHVLEDKSNDIELKEQENIFGILEFSPASLDNLKRSVKAFQEKATNIIHD